MITPHTDLASTGWRVYPTAAGDEQVWRDGQILLPVHGNDWLSRYPVVAIERT